MVFERAMVVSYRFSIVAIALFLTILPQFPVECLQPSSQQGMGHFGSKFGEKGVTDVSQILTPGRHTAHGAVVYERNPVDIFCRLSTMHERDRQRDDGTVTCNTKIGS